MPQYDVKTPDGETYEVTAPEGATQEQVFAYVQQNRANLKAEAPAKAAPSFLDSLKEFGGKIEMEGPDAALGHIIVGGLKNWWESNKANRNSGMPSDLEKLYQQKTGKAPDLGSKEGQRAFIKFTATDPDAAKHLYANPILQGMSPGEGLARAEIPGRPGPAIPLSEVQQGVRMAGHTEKIQRQAANTVAKRFNQDVEGSGKTAEQVIQEMNEARAAGKPVTLADVGENLRGLAGNVARQPGPARTAMTNFLEARGKGAAARVAGDINQHIASGSAYDTVKALQESRSKAASPLYDEAFKANQNVRSPVIDRILKTPAGRKALAMARVKMQNDRTLMGVPDKELTEQAREAGQIIQGGRGVASGLKLRTLDYVKRALDDQIGAARRAGERDNARILSDMRTDFVNALDEADVTGKAGPNSEKPEGGAYKRARAAYSGPSRSADAVEEGRGFLGKSAEEIRDDMAKLSEGDREFYKLGAADALRGRPNVLKQVVDRAGDFGNNVRRQLRPLFDSDAALSKFVRAIEAEVKMAQTGQKVIGGSPTQERTVEDQYSNALAAGAGAARSIAHAKMGNWLAAMHNAINARRDIGMLRTNQLRNLEIGRLLADPTLRVRPNSLIGRIDQNRNNP